MFCILLLNRYVCMYVYYISSEKDIEIGLGYVV